MRRPPSTIKPGRERPGLIVGGRRRTDGPGFGADYGEAVFGPAGLARLGGWLSEKSPPPPPRRGGGGGGPRGGGGGARWWASDSTTAPTRARRVGRPPPSPCCSSRRRPRSPVRTTTSSSPRAAPRPTGRWSLRLSSGAARATSSGTPDEDRKSTRLNSSH